MHLNLVKPLFCLAFIVVIVSVQAQNLTSRQAHVPYGCYPTPVLIKTNSDQLQLVLTDTVPEVYYLVLARTNEPYSRWFLFASANGDLNTNVTIIRFSLKSGGENSRGRPEPLSPIPANMLSRMVLVAGSGEDTDGDGLPDVYEDLITLSDPLGDNDDVYRDLDGDNWTTIEEFHNGTDPLIWNEPPAPSGIEVKHNTNGTVAVTWREQYWIKPTFYTVFRQYRDARQSIPPSRIRSPRKPPMRSEDRSTTPDSDLKEIARINSLSGDRPSYTFIDTNVQVDILRPPVYSVRATFPPPAPRIVPARSDETGIRQTIRRVTWATNQNGFQLTVAKTVPHLRYLMLAREESTTFWKASGFFMGSTNGTVKLMADSRGMLLASTPSSLPHVKHISTLEHPEFTTGSGEDADGDGLPDIYEVLVTKTNPSRTDTGSTGLSDGYKDSDGDGWTNLEEYRRRTNPLSPNIPPQPVMLTEPTRSEIWKAFRQMEQSDFQYESRIEIRDMNSKGAYQPVESLSKMFPQMQGDPKASNLQIRVSLQVPEKKLRRLD